ncbi:MAG TPA: hypothetical protein DDW67_05340 [Elusimicrobia bacterium]|nr:hypothetical protein [Elusimicrobiota bacterium]
MERILVIEDDWNFQRLMVVALSEHGFAAESADTAAAGLKKAWCSRPDLILLDYNLGDMKGHDAAQWLEFMRGTRAIPVLLLTGMAGSPEVREAMSASRVCRGILPKTMPLAEIVGNIRKVLKEGTL